MTDGPGFERRHPVIDLNDKDLTARLAGIVSADQIATAGLLSGGRVNSNYLLKDASGAPHAVLRLYARGRNVAGLERDILRRLASTVPVPQILHDGTDGAPAFLLLSWVPGETLEAALQSGGPAESLGRATATALAPIHATLQFPAMGLLGPGLEITTAFPGGSESFLGFIKRALAGRMPDRLGPDLTKRFTDFVEAAAPLLDQRPKTACLVHSDFNPPNLRVSGGDAPEVTGVLDWEFAHAGDPLTDLANMLRPRDHQPEAFNQAFVETYQDAAGPLPDNWLSVARLLDLVSQVNFLGGPESRPMIIRWAKAQIIHTMDYVER